MTALQIINATVDPEFPNGIPPIEAEQTTPAPALVLTETEWVTLTGTYYPSPECVPWQAKGSAVEVPAIR